ncbi:histamine H1 receptor-like [Patiria miniata]|uniref:G-protein coupled receptors family 1 profile domain-containing protein n=1 Tax=Patiria miniata TaxID=46514 RepID=A0A914ASJ3_PATMI|nr:histamine H1 receptor-like [Patiria miniata]
MASGALWTEHASLYEVSGDGGPVASPVYVLYTNTTGLPSGVWHNDTLTYGVGPRTIGIAVPFATFMTLLSLITIFGNSLVIYAVRTEKRLQTVSNYFIVSLAVSDLLIGIIVMPISTIYFVSGDWVLGLVVCQLWLCIDYVSSTASIFNLLVLSLDRYWSIRFPLKYMRKRTGKRATIMISCAWLLSFLWIIPITCWHAIFNQGNRGVPSNICDTEFGENKPLKVGTAIGNFYVPLACLICIYAKIFHEIQKRSKMVLGRRSVGGTRKAARSGNSLPSKGTDVELTRVDDATWTPDYDDSISTSKDTSNETPDQTENNSSSPSSDRGRAIKKPKRINNQLRNISNLTLLTVGLHGIVDPEAVRKAAAGKDTSPTASTRGSCTRSPCCHGDSRIRETQFLSPGDAATRKEPSSRHRHHVIAAKNSLDRDKGTCAASEELRPLRSRTYQTQNGSKKSILRRNSTVEGDSVPNGNLSSRKISFSTEDLPGRSGKSSRIGCMPTKKKLTAELRGSEVGRGERETKGRRNGVTSRLLSVEHRIDASASNTESDEDVLNHPHHHHHQHHIHANSRGKFSLSRFSMRPGRATETLRRIRKMSLSKERKAAKQLGVIVGCFICCWVTYMVFFMIVAFCSHCIDPDVYFGSIWLGYINSTLNPVIYPMCNSTFRKAFKKILRIKKR